MIPHHFAPLLNCTSCLLVDLCHPFSLCSSLPHFFPSPPTACPPLFLLVSQWSSCLSALLSSLICEVTLEVCDTDLLFQEAVGGFRVGRAGCGGSDFLARETAVNQIVKDEVFLSFHLEWISLSSGATQKSWKGSSACLHLDRRRGRGSVLCTLLKWLRVVKIFRWALLLFLYISPCSSAHLPLNTRRTAPNPTSVGHYYPSLLASLSPFLGQTFLCALNEDSRVQVSQCFVIAGTFLSSYLGPLNFPSLSAV